MAELGVDVPWIEHPQGFRRAGQLPFPQYRGTDGKAMDNPLWMPDSIEKLEARIIEKTIGIQPSPVTRQQVSSVVTRQDPKGTGGRIFNKAKAVGRIDGIVALAMADGAAEMRLPKMDLSGFLKRPVMS
jgi:phage terminase large subunit-like protein